MVLNEIHLLNYIHQKAVAAVLLLTSQILRGENEGRIAKHEFVVVGFSSATSNISSKEIKNYKFRSNKFQSNKFQNKDFQWDMKLPELHNSDARAYGLAIWGSEITIPTPLQVVGGLLPNYKK